MKNTEARLKNEIGVETFTVASAKFGLILEASNKILLIKRDHLPLCNPECCYMTIKYGRSDSGASFSDGHYDMSLTEALNSFKERTGEVDKLVKYAPSFASVIKHLNKVGGFNESVADAICEKMQIEDDELRLLINLADDLAK